MVEDGIAHPHHGQKPDDEDEAIAEKEVQPIVNGGAFNLRRFYEFSSAGVVELI